MADAPKGEAKTIMDWIFKGITGLLLILATLVVDDMKESRDQRAELRMLIAELELRVAVIESNRYTPKDALEFERKMDQRLDDLGDQLSELRGDIRALLDTLRKKETTTP